MAMIKCPECGEEISEHAKTCPHCGVEIFVCPECGQVSLGRGPCTSCGYALPVEHEEKAPEPTKEENKKSIHDRWSESATGEKTRKVVLDVLSAALVMIPLIYCLVWYSQSLNHYTKISPQSYLQLIVSYSSDVDRLNRAFYMIVFMAVILPAIIDAMGDFYSEYNFAKWIRTNRIDISQEINAAVSRSAAKKEKKEDDEDLSFSEVMKEAKQEVKDESTEAACFMVTNPNKAYLLAVLRLIPKIAWCVLEIVAMVWVKNTTMSFMSSTLAGRFETDANGATIFTRNFKVEWWPFLLWAGIIFVIAVVVQIIFSRMRKKIILDTLKKVHKKA